MVNLSKKPTTSIDIDTKQIPIKKLFISKGNIRKLDVEAEELIPSIKKDGVKKPLNVYPAGDKFGIWDGQRRYLAAKKVGLKYLPCFVYKEIKDEGQAKEFSLIDTLLRTDVNPLDKAKAIVEEKEKLGSLKE